MSNTAPCCGENKHNWSEADQDVCDACLMEDLRKLAKLGDEQVELLAKASAAIIKQGERLEELEKQRDSYILLTGKAAKNDRRMIERRNDALKLPLMFHRGGIWSAEDVAEWRRITGSDEATTKVMCDHICRVCPPTTDYFDEKGMLRTKDGERSIFDDVDK
jgi:hypothetical protein